GSQYFYLFGDYSTTHNPIVSNVATDALGRSTLQYSNLRDRSPSSFSFNTVFSKTLKKSDINVGGFFSTFGNIYYSLINGALNRTVSATYSGELTTGKSKQNSYGFSMRFGPTYTTNTASLQ